MPKDTLKRHCFEMGTHEYTTSNGTYTWKERIGYGATACVWRAERSDGKQFAIKTMCKYAADGREDILVDTSANNEIHINKVIQSKKDPDKKYILRYEEYFMYESGNDPREVYYCLVFDYAKGGKLEFVEFMTSNLEEVIKVVTLFALRAIRFLHRHNIVHSDIKPQNFMLLDGMDLNSLVLGDFGGSNIIKNDLSHNGLLRHEEMEIFTCSPFYMAPEMYQDLLDGSDIKMEDRGISKEADIYALGISSAEWLLKENPFDILDVSEEERKKALEQRKVDFNNVKGWDKISPEAQDFLLLLTRRKRSERPSAEEALKHNWMPESQTRKTIIIEFLCWSQKKFEFDLPSLSRFRRKGSQEKTKSVSRSSQKKQIKEEEERGGRKRDESPHGRSGRKGKDKADGSVLHGSTPADRSGSKRQTGSNKNKK